jgi:hypothetical protein
VHFVSNNFLRRDGVLAVIPITDEHSGENMCKLIELALIKHKLSYKNIISITRDGAKNMQKLCNTASLPSFQCIAHFLHLVVNGAIFSNNRIEGTIKRLRSIVGFLHRSPYAAQKLAEVQKQLSLPVRKIPMVIVLNNG